MTLLLATRKIEATRARPGRARMASLDRAQAEYVALPPGPHAFIGIPGGGKTNTLLRRVARLVRDGVLERFLLLTFSKDAAGELVRVGGTLGADGLTADGEPLFTKDNTLTVHALGRRIVADVESVSAFVKTNVSTYVYALRDALATEEGRQAARAKYAGAQAIFVDEAQDLNAPQHDAITSLAAALGTTWIELVGDPDQNIYAGMQESTAAYLLSHAGRHGGTAVRLTSNFRSTRQIVGFANDLRPSEVAPEDAMTAAAGTEGDAPAVVCGTPAENVEEAVRRIVALRDAGTPLEDIAVLGSVRKTYSRSGAKTAGLTLIANKLVRANVGIAIHFSEYGDGEGEDADDRQVAHVLPGRVSLLTMHSSKGLAFPHVFLLNFNRQPMGFDTEIAGVDRLLYVGVTRARASLTAFVNTGPIMPASPWCKQEWDPPARLLPKHWPPGYAPPEREERPDKKQKAEAELKSGKSVTGMLKDVLRGEREFALLRRFVAGLRITPLTPSYPDLRAELANVDRNDAALLGKAAELLAVRATMDHADFVARFLADPNAGPEKQANDVRRVVKDYAAYLRRAECADDPVAMVWRFVLYEHQLQNEARYRLMSDEHGRGSSNIRRLRKMLPSLEEQGRAFLAVIGPHLNTQVRVSRALRSAPNIEMYHGHADVVHADDERRHTVCELKLSKDGFNFRAVLQLVLYAHTDPMFSKEPPRQLLWNMARGEAYEVEHDWDDVRAWLDGLEVRMKTAVTVTR